jgi:hypothetical protein
MIDVFPGPDFTQMARKKEQKQKQGVILGKGTRSYKKLKEDLEED